MPLNQSLSALEQHDEFIGRHIGPCASEMAAMLATIGADSLDQLIDQTVPAAIRLPADLPLPAPRREHVRVLLDGLLARRRDAVAGVEVDPQQHGLAARRRRLRPSHPRRAVAGARRGRARAVT